MTLIRIGLLYPSIHNSFITNKRIEVKLAQHMVYVSCPLCFFKWLFILRVQRSDRRIEHPEIRI
jgi:hypothetical protein